MKFVFGLGNPEKEYAGTRHNVGKNVINVLACELVDNHGFNIRKVFGSVFGNHSCGEWRVNRKLNAQIFKSDSVMLVKPLRYMNDSGVIIRDVVNFYKADFSDVAVVYDDLDLMVGEFKAKEGSATKVHNGVGSILDAIGAKNFKKIFYVKVGVREKKIPMSVKNFGLKPNTYVLGKFPKEDKIIIDDTIKNAVVPAILTWLSK